MNKIRTVGKHITFCPECEWFEIQDKEKGTRKCPECNCWGWTIYQYKYYDGKKLVDQEAGLTDENESDFQGISLRELNKIFNRGLQLMGVSVNPRRP